MYASSVCLFPGWDFDWSSARLFRPFVGEYFNVYNIEIRHVYKSDLNDLIYRRPNPGLI